MLLERGKKKREGERVFWERIIKKEEKDERKERRLAGGEKNHPFQRK